MPLNISFHISKNPTKIYIIEMKNTNKIGTPKKMQIKISKNWKKF